MDDKEYSQKVEAFRNLGIELEYHSYDPGPNIAPGADYSREWAANTHIPMGLIFLIFGILKRP